MMLMFTCDSPFSNQFMKLGSLACTTVVLAPKADSQLQKDGRRQAQVMLLVAQRNFHRKIPLKTWMFRNIADSRKICS